MMERLEIGTIKNTGHPIIEKAVNVNANSLQKLLDNHNILIDNFAQLASENKELREKVERLEKNFRVLQDGHGHTLAGNPPECPTCKGEAWLKVKMAKSGRIYSVNAVGAEIFIDWEQNFYPSDIITADRIKELMKGEK